jgi:hypothetical protein
MFEIKKKQKKQNNKMIELLIVCQIRFFLVFSLLMLFKFIDL